MMGRTDALDPGWKPLARPDLVVRSVGREWVLFDPSQKRLHLLDLSSAFVWSCCTGEHDVRAIERELRRAFGDEVEHGSRVRDVLTDLLDAHLLES